MQINSYALKNPAADLVSDLSIIWPIIFEGTRELEINGVTVPFTDTVSDDEAYALWGALAPLPASLISYVFEDGTLSVIGHERFVDMGDDFLAYASPSMGANFTEDNFVIDRDLLASPNRADKANIAIWYAVGAFVARQLNDIEDFETAGFQAEFVRYVRARAMARGGEDFETPTVDPLFRVFFDIIFDAEIIDRDILRSKYAAIMGVDVPSESAFSLDYLPMSSGVQAMFRPAAAHHATGAILSALCFNDSALAHYGRAVDMEPANPQYNFDLAQLLANSGRLDEALHRIRTAYEQALIDDESAALPQCLLMMYAIHCMRGEPEEALEAIRKLCELQGTQLQITEADAWTQAAEAGEEIAQQTPQLLKWMAIAYRRAGRNDDAAGAVRRFLGYLNYDQSMYAMDYLAAAETYQSEPFLLAALEEETRNHLLTPGGNPRVLIRALLVTILTKEGKTEQAREELEKLMLQFQEMKEMIENQEINIVFLHVFYSAVNHIPEELTSSTPDQWRDMLVTIAGSFERSGDPAMAYNMWTCVHLLRDHPEAAQQRQ